VWEWQLGDPRRALVLTERALAHLNGTDERCAARLSIRWDRLARKTRVRSVHAV